MNLALVRLFPIAASIAFALTASTSVVNAVVVVAAVIVAVAVAAVVVDDDDDDDGDVFLLIDAEAAAMSASEILNICVCTHVSVRFVSVCEYMRCKRERER